MADHGIHFTGFTGGVSELTGSIPHWGRLGQIGADWGKMEGFGS